MEIGFGLDVDPNGGLVDDQDLDIGGKPFGNGYLLLIPAGEVGDDLIERWSADVQPLDEGLDRLPLLAGGDEAEGAAEPGPYRDRDVVLDGMHEDEALLLAIFADITHAICLQRVMHVGDPRRFAADEKVAAGDLSFTENGASEFTATGTDEPVEAQDLAAMEGESDIAVAERGCEAPRLHCNPALVDLALAELCDAFLAADHQRDQILAGHR